MQFEFLQSARPSRSQQIIFLQPFRQLVRMWKVRIGGAVDVDIVVEFQRYLMINPFPSPEAVHERVNALKAEDDKQSKLSNHSIAAVRYEQAIATLNFFFRWTLFSSPTAFKPNAGRYTGKPISCAKVFETFRLYNRLALASVALGLVEQAEAAARNSDGGQLCYELKRFSTSDEKIAVKHYIMALVSYEKARTTGLENSFKDTRTELRKCRSLLSNDAGLLANVFYLNIPTYEHCMLKTEQDIPEREKRRGRRYFA